MNDRIYDHCQYLVKITARALNAETSASFFTLIMLDAEEGEARTI